MSEPPTLLQGDCFEVLQTLEAESVDACVTDPPYGFGDGKTAGFMGKAWDRDVPSADMWREVFRVLKPGAHLLSFFGTRTYHRGVVAIEDAGFEIRDQIGWLYGSGFPKSLDVGKAIDKAAGVEREVIGERRQRANSPDSGVPMNASAGEVEHITAPATDAAKQWDGWGTALAPGWEPICVARKPLIGTVANNVLTHGTGGLNINDCRVMTGQRPSWESDQNLCDSCAGLAGSTPQPSTPATRESIATSDAGRTTSAKDEASHLATNKTATGCFGGTKAGDTVTSLSTAEHGKTPTDPSRRDTKSTTSTKTAQTTGSKTCASCSKPITSQSTNASTTAEQRSLLQEQGRPENAGHANAPAGRWPKNVIHDGSDEVLAEFAKYGESKSTPGMRGTMGRSPFSEIDGSGRNPETNSLRGHADTGTAARFFKACEETDEEWIQQHLGLIASTAESCFNLQNQHVVSALNRAVTSALRVGMCSVNLWLEHSMSATPKELRTLCESVTEAIPNIAQKYLLGLPQEKPSEQHSHASVVTSQTQTGITTITIDRWKSDGSAAPVTFSITATNTDRGAADSQHARFYYTSKASKDDRNDGLHDYGKETAVHRYGAGIGEGHDPNAPTYDKNFHPTVKPTSLMRYLVRLVCPKGGLVLDPFAGSGTTLIAAYREDCRSIGIELDPGYFKMASHRIDKATAQLRLEL